MRLAVGHFNSWESNDHRARAEYMRLQDRVEQLRRSVDQDALQHVRGYEQARHEELKRVALADDDNPYRLARRALRGWDIIRDRWQSQACRNCDNRIKVLAELQGRLRGRFGDPHFYRWLADDAQEPLWRGADPLPHIVLLNDAMRRLSRKKNGAAFTGADARQHPRWVQFERSGGSNLHDYHLNEDAGELYLLLPLLRNEGNGILQEVEHRIRLARSGQFAQVKLHPPERRGGAPVVDYRSAHQMNKAQLGSADILFKRSRLENHPVGRLAEGEIGPAWLKIALDVVVQIPDLWQGHEAQKRIKAQISHFMQAASVGQSAGSALEPGLRVLSVDLGVRTFAACSVFTLTDNPPGTALHFRVQGMDGLWAQHERSFLLTLPGESPDRGASECRGAVMQELADLRASLFRLNELLRLSVQADPEVRRLILSGWLDGAGEEDDNLKRLLGMTDAQPTAWERAVLDWRIRLDAKTGNRISQWREHTRPRAADGEDHRHRRGYHGGKSAWAIQYLTDVRRLLLRWSLHGRRSGHIRCQDRQGGVFASHLLRHINALKDDRIKTGADLIVQAARGLVHDDNGNGREKYAPCQLVLLENLARYRFRTDRSRRENSQLMRWCHRAIHRETEMQAQAYGMQIRDTAAGFSSRYHARTGAPGLRVRRVTQADLDDPATKMRLLDAMQSVPGTRGEPSLGDLVPWPGGPEFVTVSPGGQSLVVLHADINAAQNLQRRLWTRHTDAYRMIATRFDVAGQEIWLPNPVGKRLLGALVALGAASGYARLSKAADGDGYVLTPIRKVEWTRAIGAEIEPEAETEGRMDEDADVEMLDELADAVRTRASETFFRDPSGVVLPADRWYPAKVFWSRVQARIVPLLRPQSQDPF